MKMKMKCPDCGEEILSGGKCECGYGWKLPEKTAVKKNERHSTVKFYEPDGKSSGSRDVGERHLDLMRETLGMRKLPREEKDLVGTLGDN
ncbi:MAG: hypothetical protein ACTSP4_00610 [Candidatus Hodarchaeales archaeon]